MFVAANLQEVIKLPIDMSCINEKLLKILSDQINVNDLDRVDDPKDKLLSKIYMKKVDSLIRDHDNKYML